MRQLGDVRELRHKLIALEHHGCERTGPWSGGPAFILADEAAVTIESKDRTPCKVPLVGHSYGGGVALRAASRGRIVLLASLSVNPPAQADVGPLTRGPEVNAAIARRIARRKPSPGKVACPRLGPALIGSLSVAAKRPRHEL